MRHPDYDRAFHETPDYIRSAIELGMRKGEQKMKMHQKFMSALAVAAAFAVILGAAALGASRLAAPKPGNRVASQPVAPAAGEGSGGAAATLVTPQETALPEPTLEPELPETVYYTQGGRYFHIERECSGLENGIEGSVDDAYHAGKEPCPVCLAGWSFEVNAVPEVTPEDTPEPVITPRPTPEPVVTPEDTPEPLITPRPTPEPVVGAEAEAEAAETGEVEVEEAEFEYAYLGLSPENVVYCAPDDDCFHFDANCPELEGQVTVVTSLGAAMRNHRACETCKPMEAAVVYSQAEGVMRSAATGDILVYYNPNGAYFHVKYDCSGMMGAQLHTLEEAVEARKFHCPVCIGDQEERYWLDVPAEDGDLVYTSPYSGYYHRSGDCFHLPSVAVDTYGAVKEGGALAPCPRCLPELAGAFASPLCYAGDGDPFYHSSSMCEKLSGDVLGTITEFEAQAEGRVRCHACTDESALPAYGEEFVELFGSWLDGAYPGWIFERADARSDGGADWYVSTDEEDVTPNPQRACRVTAEPDGGVSFELGGDSMDMFLSHDFLNALPAEILTACERDAMEAILNAMEAPDEARAGEVFENVDMVRIEAEADGAIAAFELEFRAPVSAPGESTWFGGNAIALRWQSADGGYELCNTEVLGKD